MGLITISVSSLVFCWCFFIITWNFCVILVIEIMSVTISTGGNHKGGQTPQSLKVIQMCPIVTLPWPLNNNQIKKEKKHLNATLCIAWGRNDCASPGSGSKLSQFFSFLEFVHSKIKLGSVLSVASGLRVKNYKQNDRSRCSNQSIWIQTKWGDKGAGYW